MPPGCPDRQALLAWFAPRARAYPWRRSSDPYRILVSEVMLQQTQVSRVVPAYRTFLRAFPSLRRLASARRSEVVAAWGGLGYPRRAVALSEAARAIVRERGGRVPSEPASLQELPGVGPYTASAVASIAFGVPVAAVDTNVRRILARVALGAEPDDVPPAELGRLAQAWLDEREPGAWNQALMDLGREVCRPRPRCETCPLAPACRFRVNGTILPAPGRRQPPFEGSMRQVRGAVVRQLRASQSRTVSKIARDAELPIDRVTDAVRSLAADRIVHAPRSVLEGNPQARVRLAD